KLRSGLELVGLRADVLLRHGDGRLVYGVALAKNFRDVLLGVTDRRVPLIPKTKAKEATATLSRYWIERWLARRIEVPGVLDAVAKNTLVHPVTHGARVRLPADDALTATQNPLDLS